MLLTHTVDSYCCAYVLQECSIGQETSLKPTTTTDRSCKQCSTGFYQDEAGKEVCKVATVCEDTEYEVTAPTSSSNRECGLLTVCEAGFYEATPPTSATNRQCTSCLQGTFSSSTGQSVCEAHSTTCPSGKYQSAAGTPTSDRTCMVVTVCTAGQQTFAEPTNTTDRVCEPCPPQTFSAQPGTSTCTPFKACAFPVEYIANAGTASKGRCNMRFPSCSHLYYAPTHNFLGCRGSGPILLRCVLNLSPRIFALLSLHLLPLLRCSRGSRMFPCPGVQAGGGGRTTPIPH